MAERDFDVVLYGATGFTGRQTVDYFRTHAPKGLRWAIAGRSREKLEAMGAGVPVVVADAADQERLDAMVARTRVVLSTAGPFKLYGHGLVDACVRLGAHYVDIGGEATWIRPLIDKHHGSAEQSQLRIVPGCGVCSVPADLGVFHLNQRLGGRLAQAKAYFNLAGGMFNGGTVASDSLAHDLGDVAQSKDIFLLGPHTTRPILPFERDPSGIAFDREVGLWTAPCPMGVSDTRAVRMSASLLGQEIAFQEYMGFAGASGLLKAVAFKGLMAVFGALLAFGPSRRWLQKATPPGSGPSEAVMNAGFYECRIVGKTDDGRSGELTLRLEGDPANRITVRCVCEAALALACDEAQLPRRFGVLTPSTAFGDTLVQRLIAQGMVLRDGA
jgi:short subunit dehydrogenase-like uncharacterized protein